MARARAAHACGRDDEITPAGSVRQEAPPRDPAIRDRGGRGVFLRVPHPVRLSATAIVSGPVRLDDLAARRYPPRDVPHLPADPGALAVCRGPGRRTPAVCHLVRLPDLSGALPVHSAPESGGAGIRGGRGTGAHVLVHRGHVAHLPTVLRANPAQRRWAEAEAGA